MSRFPWSRIFSCTLIILLFDLFVIILCIPIFCSLTALLRLPQRRHDPLSLQLKKYLQIRLAGLNIVLLTVVRIGHFSVGSYILWIVYRGTHAHHTNKKWNSFLLKYVDIRHRLKNIRGAPKATFCWHRCTPCHQSITLSNHINME